MNPSIHAPSRSGLPGASGREMFELDPRPMLVFDVDSLQLLAVNDAAAAQYGYERARLLAMSLVDLHAADEIPAVHAFRAQQGDSVVRGQLWRHRRSDGTQIEVEVDSRPIGWPGRSARLALATDVTERRRVERALREQAALLELTYDCIIVRDAGDDRITLWNRGSEECYGWLREDALGRVSHDLLGTRFPAPLERIREELFRRGKWEGDLVQTARDGQEIVVSSRWVLQRDAAGEPVSILEIHNDITERTRAEAALRESEARFRQLAEHIDAAFWLFDQEARRTLYVSPSYERIWGIPREQVYRDAGAWIRAVHPEDRGRVEGVIRDHEGEGYEVEYRIVRPDGEIRWLRDRAYPIRDAQGRVCRFAGIAEDTTERRRAQRALASAGAHYRRLVEHSPYGIYTLDVEGCFTELNPAAGAILGRAPESLIGMNFLGVVAPECVEAVARSFRLRLAGGQGGEELEVRVVRPDGQRRLLHVRTAAIVEDGGITGTHGIARDVTEDRARDERMRLLASALEGLEEEGVSISDDRGHLLFANATHARLLGYDPARREQISIGDFLPDEAARRELEAVFERVDHGQSWSGRLQRRRLDDGRMVALDTLIGRVRDDQRRLYFAILQDAAPRMLAEMQLRRAERLASVGTLVSGVAHELNNPLHAVINFAELLLLDERSPADREALEIIAREAARAARVVGELRMIARRTQERAEEREPVDLNEVVRHVLKLRRYTQQTHNVVVEEELGPDLAPILADRGQMEQLVLNLVVNAEQAMDGQDRPRRLVVRTRGRPRTVSLQVADTGCGIAREKLDRIFDPFWTTKPPGQGTGLGLSLVHSLVTEHGGTIRVESEPGYGTELTLDFPAAPAAGGVEEPAAADPPPARALDVLVVDDEAANRRLLVRYLAQRGHRVHEAREGGEALRLLAGRAFDVIVSDLRMPGISGERLLETLRADPARLDRRLIFVTGDAASSGASRILAESGVPVLLKPVQLRELTRVIETRNAPRTAPEAP